ncbi:MAG: HYR domain-containing protein [Acidobacteriota bacterium]
MLIGFVAVLCLLPAISRADSISSVSPTSFNVGAVEEYLSISGTGLVGSDSTEVVFTGSAGTVVQGVDGSSTNLFVFMPIEVLNTAGHYSVTVRAIDAAGVRTIGPAFIDIIDRPVQQPPLLNIPEVVSAEATTAAGAVVTFTVSGTSFVDPAPIVTCNHASGDLYPLGQTTVSCTATDSFASTAGNFEIQVTDTVQPVLSLPADFMTANQVVTFTATATDAIDGSVPTVCSPASGSTFNVGFTTVTCKAGDAHANIAVGTFRVSVVVGPLPTLTLPSDFSIEATRVDGAVAAYSTSSSDGSAVICDPPSGTVLRFGLTHVQCSATNANGTTEGSFNVTVVDTTPPLLTLPATLVVEAPTNAGIVVEFEATAFDIVSQSVPVNCLPPSGSNFPVGSTTVLCSATDLAGNSASGSFTITVHSAQPPPTLSLPADFTREAASASGVVVTYTASADQGAVATCAPLAGSTFPLGLTTVNCTATGPSGTTTGSFKVTVVDTTPPALSLPGNITRDATGPGGAVVTYTATASDLVDGAVGVTCTPPSGSTFVLGTTTVQCSSTDAHTNTALGSFTITVVRTKPVLVLPADIVAEATSPAGATVTYTATAHDNVVSSLPITCSPASGSNFPLGPTMVQCSATNPAGTTTGVFLVDVQDRTPPIVFATVALPTSLWPPNHQMEHVIVLVAALDQVDILPSSRIVSVTSNQPVTGQGDNTSPDWVITGPLTVDLRAERLGNSERIYTITVETSDHAGNAVTTTTEVRVAQSRRRPN